MTDRMSALDVECVYAGYGDATVLRGVSLTVPCGEVVALLGENGAGKSTLFRTISGLLRPTGGSVRLFGTDVTALAPHKRVELGLCHIPEGRRIFKHLTVRENLCLPVRKREEASTIERATDAFPILGERINQLAGTLSGGEQQMLSMSRALHRNRRLLIVDEASSGLAPLVVDEIFDFLQRIVREQRTSVLIADQFAARALDIASTAHVIHRGQMTATGAPDDLRGTGGSMASSAASNRTRVEGSSSRHASSAFTAMRPRSAEQPHRVLCAS